MGTRRQSLDLTASTLMMWMQPERTRWRAAMSRSVRGEGRGGVRTTGEGPCYQGEAPGSPDSQHWVTASAADRARYSLWQLRVPERVSKRTLQIVVGERKGRGGGQNRTDRTRYKHPSPPPNTASQQPRLTQ